MRNFSFDVMISSIGEEERCNPKWWLRLLPSHLERMRLFKKKMVKALKERVIKILEGAIK